MTVGGPAGPFSDLVVFSKDHTLVSRNSLRFDGVGRGVWEDIGDGTFATTLEFFADPDNPVENEFNVRVRVRNTLLIDQDTLQGTSTIDVFTVDGATHLAGPFQAVSETTRMKVIPEEGIILDDGDDDDDDD